ncbi:MAG: hypothetical protein KDC87_16295, partial [Planctomycetes bacterium]|nr:hypothetical protein [Planctomycetota bacterium]
MKKKLSLALAAFALVGTSCVGVRSDGNRHSVHAEAFNIFGFTVPADDQATAWAKVPAGATIHTAYSSPADWTSVVGAL